MVVKPSASDGASHQALAVGDCVTFAYRGKSVCGHIASKSKSRAMVVTEDGAYRVGYPSLQPVPGAKRKLVHTPTDEHKARFAAGDRVSFTSSQGEVLSGRISRMNAKRASVLLEDGRHFRVAYAQLRAETDNSDRREHLDAVARQAEKLFAEHGLTGWSFQFDDAPGRGGVCRHNTQVISLSRGYSHAATAEQVTNTLLHEIAHALVGPKHHHDAVWKQAARRIGCTAERCHQVSFTPPRYIGFCPKCDRAHGAQIRRKLLCRKCRVRLQYRPNTEAWSGTGQPPPP